MDDTSSAPLSHSGSESESGQDQGSPYQSAVALLKSGEEALAGSPSDPSRLDRAEDCAAKADALLRPLAEKGDHRARMLLASTLTLRGHLGRERRSLDDALTHYDAALELLAPDSASDIPAPPRQNQCANVWTNRGLALLAANDAGLLQEALQCFDEAITLRQDLPLAEDPQYPWGLAASWMNRAETLTKMDAPANTREAVENYDEAIACLRDLPLDDPPSYRTRLAVAWMNRAIALQGGGDRDEAADADVSRCFEEAIETLRASTIPDHPEHTRTLAVALTNRGISLLDKAEPDPDTSRNYVRDALSLIADIEKDDPEIAGLGLQARHAWCRALIQLLNRASASAQSGEEDPDDENDNGESIDLVDEATDMVEEALALERLWESKGARHLRPLAADLFRFGCQVYRQTQPQFLAEFVLECLDPDKSPGAPADSPEMHLIAEEELNLAAGASRRQGFSDFGQPRLDRLLETMQDIRAAHQRLEVLQKRYLDKA